MTATVHAFPALNSPGAARGWVLVLIAFLHVGFFYLLTSGLARPVIQMLAPPLEAFFPETRTDPPPAPPELPIGNPVITRPTVTPPVPVPIPIPQTNDVITAPVSVPGPAIDVSPAPAEPVIVEPAIPARGLSEPVYPPSEIRQNHTGTVLLSIYVLEDGRVGEVRVMQSSGYPRLDDSAAREARRWRLVPGTQDGLPTPMWRQIPVTFRLN